MSGGHLNGNGYHYHHARDAADELRREAEPLVWDEYDERDVPNQFTEETRVRFRQVSDLLEAAARAWKEADYLLSGDTGEDTWLSEETLTVLDALRGVDARVVG